MKKIYRCPRCKSFETEPAYHSSAIALVLSVFFFYIFRPLGLALFFLAIALFLLNLDRRICSDCRLIYKTK